VQLDRYAPRAERASFARDDVGDVALTHWLLEARTLMINTTASTRPQLDDPHHHEHGGHHHHSQLVAVSFADDMPALGDKYLDVLRSLGTRLLRAKGFVMLASKEHPGAIHRGFIEHAGRHTSLRDLGEWNEMPRRSEMVIIGDGLDEAALRRALWACRAGYRGELQ
jgi:G3E family GTPase